MNHAGDEADVGRPDGPRGAVPVHTVLVAEVREAGVDGPPPGRACRPPALSLSDRWYDCECGNSRCRDENAALNVLRAGRARWASSTAMAVLAQEAAGL